MYKKLMLILILIAMVGCAITQNEPDATTQEVEKLMNESQKHVLNCVGEDGHHVYSEEISCPLGGESFDALSLGTHSTYGRHLDWEPVSYMRFPVPISVCPSNGFVITQEKYSDEELADIKKLVETPEYQNIFKEKHATYYLYAKNLELLGKPSNEMWWLYLNATWEADLCTSESKYQMYAKKVIEEATKSLLNMDATQGEYWMLNIIMPNMYRRIGEFDKAKKLVSELKTPSLEDAEANEFYTLAFELLNQAIDDKSTAKIAIEPEDEE